MHAKVSSIPDDIEGERESTRPIRALNRGLEVLTELNRLERAPINTLAGAVRLPRTTTYRILETLRLAGYVVRDPHDDCYRPTIMVRALSEGFDDEAMVAHIAKPHLTALGAEIVWPVAIATPSGATMMIRETTDRESPLALERYSAGVRVPMLGSAQARNAIRCWSCCRVRRCRKIAWRAAAPRSSGCSMRLGHKASAWHSALDACPRRSVSPYRCASKIAYWPPSPSAMPRPPCRCARPSNNSCRRCARSHTRSKSNSFSNYFLRTLPTPPDMRPVTSSSAPAIPKPCGAARYRGRQTGRNFSLYFLKPSKG